MHFVRLTDGGPARWGVFKNDQLYELDPFEPLSVGDVAGQGLRNRIEAALDAGELSAVETPVDRCPPVPDPGQIVCVGLNYHDHAEEQDEEVPDKPMLFAKSPSSVTGPGEPIVHPRTVSQVDYEVELGIVIGRTAYRIDADEADEYVAGYTVLNDVSARDAQFEDGQFFRGKSYETFAPMGPVLASPDAVDPNDLAVELRVNGETKQSSTTAEFIFDVGEVIEYVSGVTTLRPGDVISTGTPGGVGIFRDPPDLLEPGDEVEAEIEGIGTLRNHVVEE